MKALKIIGIVILALIGLFLIVAAFLPSKLHMEESIVINKPATLIFRQVNDFHNFVKWSPFQEMDPEMVNTFEGPEMGLGAKNIWKSKKSGDGSMTIIESVPYSRVASSLEIGMKDASNYFELTPEQGGTKVTWGVDFPKLSYPAERYFGLMMPGMMKPVFTKGLENLKKLAEGMPDPPVLKITEFPEKAVLSITDSCNWSDIEKKMDQMFGEIMDLQKKSKFQFAGAPFTKYLKWDEANRFAVFENCVPIDKEIPVKGRVQYKVFPATRAVMGTHFGAYDKTMYLYTALDEYVKEHNLTETGGPIEEYITYAMTQPDTAKWQTNIYFPVK
jgi:effector-binding domain-containing protein